jgi:RND family efflux transporter MFP subunit
VAVFTLGLTLGGPIVVDLGPVAAEPSHAARVDTSVRGRATVRVAAPSWRTLSIQPARPAEPRWTDALPARVEQDERRAAAVGAAVDGRVRSVFVGLGEPVRAGDRLFSIASPDALTLRAERHRAALAVEAAAAHLERTRAMVAAHALPAKDEVEAHAAARQAEIDGRLAVSRLALHTPGPAPDEVTVVAPRDGVVVAHHALPSEPVRRGRALVTIADLSTVWVLADVRAADVTSLRRGARAQVTLPSAPSFRAEAEVDAVSPIADPVRHTVRVRVSLPNPHGRLRPGAHAEVRFEATPYDGAVEVAAEAVASDGAGEHVYVESREGELERRRVVVGAVRQGRAIVLRGLQPGERVVQQGAHLLDALPPAADP